MSTLSKSNAPWALVFTIIIISTFLALCSAPTPKSGPVGPVSYAQLSLEKSKPVAVITPTGSSSIGTIKLRSSGGLKTVSVPMFRGKKKQQFKGRTLPLEFELILNPNSPKTDIQVVLQSAQAATAVSACTLSLTANSTPILSQVTDAVEAPHQVALKLPKQALLPLPLSKNIFTITGTSGAAGAACANYIVETVTVSPMQIYPTQVSADGKSGKKIGVLNTSLFAQFGEVTSVMTVNNPSPTTKSQGHAKINTAIWTRGYGVADGALMIPGPTYYFKPGDILSVNLVNKLNRDSLNALNAFENAQSKAQNNDGILAGQGSIVGKFQVTDTIKHEVNIPHNLNNTNLHVHGLHVDPEKDDVTIVVIPDSETDEAEYDAPAAFTTTHHSKVPFKFPTTVAGLDVYNEGSVADRPVVSGNWEYQYKIPKIHLPGSHWFHPHKHGSTSSQVENGMAGSIVIQEETSVAVPVPAATILVNNPIVPLPGACTTSASSTTRTSSGCTSVDSGGSPSLKSQTQYDRKTWEENHDEVLMIQEIANYGVQKGAGTGQGNAAGIAPASIATVTINGVQNPTFELDSGQLQRWRLVNAGANHKAFAHIWLGERVTVAGTTTTYKYKSKTIYLVAVDGITLNKKVEINANTPILLAPGNRADILVKIDHSPGSSNHYTLFKYFPSQVNIDGTDTKITYDTNININIQNALITNPYLFNNTGYNSSTTKPIKPIYSGFKRKWSAPDDPGKNSFDGASMMPLIKVKKVKTGKGKNTFNSIDLDVAFSGDFPTATQTEPKLIGRWQPTQSGLGGGATLPMALFDLIINSTNPPSLSPDLPSDTYLASIHLKNKFGKTPSYTSQIKNSDIFQSRPVIFDISQNKIKVADSAGDSRSVSVSQFTLNGRPFALNDPVGNVTSAVNERIKHGISVANAGPKVISQRLKEVDVGNTIPDSSQKQACLNTAGQANSPGTDPVNNQKECELNITETLSIADKGQSYNWSNRVNDQYYWTNASYYQAIGYNDNSKKYSYLASEQLVYSPQNNVQVHPKPSWKSVSGLTEEAVVNAGFVSSKPGFDITKMTTVQAGDATAAVPGLPVATTAEEWIFINNSDVGHPFHIHINPFFVKEVGQLSYEKFSTTVGGTPFWQWVIRAANNSASGTTSLNPCVQTKGVGIVSNSNCAGVSSGMTINKTKPDDIAVFDGGSAIPDFTHNWWDTVIIPPHGYVKMNYWFNVPNQTGEYKLGGTGSNAPDACKVQDDVNKVGLWVYHCHILRHEDRGMMQPVITQPYPTLPP